LEFGTEAILAVVSVIATFAIMKYKQGDNDEKLKDIERRMKVGEEFMNGYKPIIDHLSRVENAHGAKLDYYGNQITELKSKMVQVPSLKDVRQEFVSCEVCVCNVVNIRKDIERIEK
jgi:hypothetical protein